MGDRDGWRAVRGWEGELNQGWADTTLVQRRRPLRFFSARFQREARLDRGEELAKPARRDRPVGDQMVFGVADVLDRFETTCVGPPNGVGALVEEWSGVSTSGLLGMGDGSNVSTSATRSRCTTLVVAVLGSFEGSPGLSTGSIHSAVDRHGLRGRQIDSVAGAQVGHVAVDGFSPVGDGHRGVVGSFTFEFGAALNPGSS